MERISGNYQKGIVAAWKANDFAFSLVSESLNDKIPKAWKEGSEVKPRQSKTLRSEMEPGKNNLELNYSLRHWLAPW